MKSLHPVHVSHSSPTQPEKFKPFYFQLQLFFTRAPTLWSRFVSGFCFFTISVVLFSSFNLQQKKKKKKSVCLAALKTIKKIPERKDKQPLLCRKQNVCCYSYTLLMKTTYSVSLKATTHTPAHTGVSCHIFCLGISLIVFAQFKSLSVT